MHHLVVSLRVPFEPTKEPWLTILSPIASSHQPSYLLQLSLSLFLSLSLNTTFNVLPQYTCRQKSTPPPPTTLSQYCGVSFRGGTTGMSSDFTAMEPADRGGGREGEAGACPDRPQEGTMTSLESIDPETLAANAVMKSHSTPGPQCQSLTPPTTTQKSFLQVMQDRSLPVTNPAAVKPPLLVEGEHVVDMDLETIRKTELAWGHCLQGRFKSASFNPTILHARLQGIWRTRAAFHVIPLHEGIILFKFDDPEDLAGVQLGGPWFVGYHRLMLRRWSFEESEEPTSFNIKPVWIRLPKLPLKYWDNEHLLSMSMAVGRPIKLDNFTASKSSGRYARICVEVDLDKPLAKGVRIRTPLGSHWQPIIYEDISEICSHCLMAGHSSKVCSQAPIATAAQSDGDRSASPPKEGNSGEQVGIENFDWFIPVRSKKRSRTQHRPSTNPSEIAFPATGKTNQASSLAKQHLSSPGDDHPEKVQKKQAAGSPSFPYSEITNSLKAKKPKAPPPATPCPLSTNKEISPLTLAHKNHAPTAASNKFAALEYHEIPANTACNKVTPANQRPGVAFHAAMRAAKSSLIGTPKAGSSAPPLSWPKPGTHLESQPNVDLPKTAAVTHGESRQLTVTMLQGETMSSAIGSSMLDGFQQLDQHTVEVGLECMAGAAQADHYQRVQKASSPPAPPTTNLTDDHPAASHPLQLKVMHHLLSQLPPLPHPTNQPNLVLLNDHASLEPSLSALVPVDQSLAALVESHNADSSFQNDCRLIVDISPCRDPDQSSKNSEDVVNMKHDPLVVGSEGLAGALVHSQKARRRKKTKTSIPEEKATQADQSQRVRRASKLDKVQDTR